jgi:hypothetical protein
MWYYALLSNNIKKNTSSVKFLSHPRVETRISHTAKNRNCAVSLVRNIGSNTDAVYIYTYMDISPWSCLAVNFYLN